MEKMINKATIVIQPMGLYELAILKWNGFDPAHKDWPNLKSHFGKAYNVCLRLGADTTNANWYHGMANATDGVDDSSIGSICESLGAIQVANNANFQVINDNMSAMSEDVQTTTSYLCPSRLSSCSYHHLSAVIWTRW